MRQNKTQYIADYYVEINSYAKLKSAMHILATEGVAFFLEPWPGNNWRLYVRKDVKRALEIVEEVILGVDAGTDGKGVSE